MPEVQDYFEFLTGHFPNISIRPERYAIINLGSGCQARIDPMFRDGTIRVSFKSTQKPRIEVEEAVRSVLGNPNNLTVDGLKLQRKDSERDPHTIWWT